jgi:hypothetical protein
VVFPTTGQQRYEVEYERAYPNTHPTDTLTRFPGERLCRAMSKQATSFKAHRALGGNLCNHWQQLVGQMIFGYKSVDTLQDLLGNLDCSRKYDDWRLRPKPSHFDCDAFPVHLGHETVDDHNVNGMMEASSNPLPPIGNSETERKSLPYAHLPT